MIPQVFIKRVQELVSAIDRFMAQALDTTGMAFVSAEFPTAGTQNAKVAYAFGLGTAMLVTYLKCYRIPFEHVTPDEVKLVATGRRQKVDKSDVELGMEQIMNREGILFEGVSMCTYLTHTYGGGSAKIEHVSDSIAAAWWSVENSATYRAFVS